MGLRPSLLIRGKPGEAEPNSTPLEQWTHTRKDPNERG